MKNYRIRFSLAMLMVACVLLLASCSNDSANAEVSVEQSAGDTQAAGILDGPSAGTTVPARPAASGAVIEIKEKMFITQTNDIYMNADDFIGKTIKYEGIFDIYTWEEQNITYYAVIRYGPGCCGTDGNAGFEVIWDGEYPSQNDWVEVVGVLEKYEEDGGEYLRLRLSSLTVLDTRGEEYVSQ